MAIKRLTDPVQFLKSVGPTRAELLVGLGIRTVGDLLHYFPRDLAHMPGQSPISQCKGKTDGVVTLAGSLKRCRLHGRWARQVFSAILTDDSGQIDLAWFNGGWMKDKFHDGDRVVVSGKLRPGRYGPQLTNPKIAPAAAPAADHLASGQWDPVYPANENITSRQIQQIIQRNLPQMLRLVDDPFPPAYLRKRSLLDRWVAVGRMHFPAMSSQRSAAPLTAPVASTGPEKATQPAESESALVLEANLPAGEIDARHAAARKRLAWDEAFIFQLALGLRRRQRQTQLRAVPLACTDEIRRRILRRFPFELTAAQVRVIGQIAADMALPAPMNRLLQGDVGSGKTVVALFAGLVAVAHGHQAAIMAPTEILAHQHFERISQYLRDSRVRFAVLTGSNSAADRKRIHEQLARGELDLVVGTSALLSKGVRFARLALAVVDEQHKFGVRQRAELQQPTALNGKQEAAESDTCNPKSEIQDPKSEIQNPKFLVSSPRPGAPASPRLSSSPHVLVMTATPIPRSLALTVFGDLAVSTIDQLPPGRGQTQTRVVAPANRDKALDFVETRLSAGGQAFFVCPRIGSADPEDELDGSDEPGEDLANAEQAFRDLQPRFEKFGIALVHGQMDRARQSAVLADFAAGRVRVLVATTVVEVGVDIARANVMAVLSAERFGLAQLHQLRGRIGRSADLAKSYCLLFAGEEASDRLKILEQTTDGQRIAEEDLARRGPGQFFGLAQHGLPEFRYVDLARDLALLRQVRQDAFKLLAADPAMAAPRYHLLKTQLAESFGKSLALIDAG